MFSRPKILFLVSLLFVALLNPKFNPYLLFKFLIHIYIYLRIYSKAQLKFDPHVRVSCDYLQGY